MTSILIIEDSPTDLDFIRRALDDVGVRNTVHSVSSVSFGIAYLKGEYPFADRAAFTRPSVILVDLHIPIVDGFEFLKWKSETPELDDILTVVISGDNHPDTRRKVRHLGANAFLDKGRLNHGLGLLLRKYPHCWAIDPVRRQLRPRQRLSS